MNIGGLFNVVLILILTVSIMSEIKVQVAEGKLVGVVVNGYNVHYFAFRGIPYAKPPVGELRFQVINYLVS